jgi:hypothetical protein
MEIETQEESIEESGTPPAWKEIVKLEAVKVKVTNR